MSIVVWFPYIGVSYLDKQDCELPVCTHLSSGWLLLQQIRSMPRKRPISVQAAWRMMLLEVHRQMALRNNEPTVPGHSNWILSNRVLWISQQGYHVELTGNEFEILDQAETVGAAA
jgi:hypothetical protein